MQSTTSSGNKIKSGFNSTTESSSGRGFRALQSSDSKDIKLCLRNLLWECLLDPKVKGVTKEELAEIHEQRDYMEKADLDIDHRPEDRQKIAEDKYQYFQEYFETKSPDQLKLCARWRSILWNLYMAAETIAHLNKEGDRAQEQINHVISTAHDGGIDDEELKEMLSLIRINPVDTAHPTECLSKYGIALHRELVSLAYEENDLKRLEKAENVIKKMIEVKSITSDGPATTREETQTGLTQFEVFWDGAKRFRRTLQGALDEHYPGFNLNDSAYVPDIATGTWRDGADADGKASSTAHVLTEGLGLSRLKVVNLILGDLEEIRKELKEEERFLLDKCSSALSPLKEKLERIDKKQLKAKTSEKIKELSEESSKLFQGAAASFVGDEFKELENKLTGESLEKVKDTHFAFLQYGLRGPRLDARHNNEIFVNIVNRVMTTENLAQFGLKYKSDLLFSQHSFNKQKNLMEQLETLLAKEPQKMELFEKLLWEATDDGSQEHEMLKRFQIIQDHPEMVNRAIIAEADKTSMHYQNLVGLPFKLNEIAQHTPLAEDDKTLETIHLISEDFSETSAGKKQKEAMKVRTASRKTPDLVAMPVMIARSDTQRNYGSGIALVQRKTVLDVVDSVLTRAGNLIRILYNGGGMATGRGGSNSADIGRIIAQRVAQYYEENDTPVTKAALAMVSRFIWTVQGRAPRILFAVPEQYANSMIGHTAEILGRQLELKRVARPGDYIYRERELSKEARKFLDETQRECTDHYYAFRHAETDEGEKIVNKWADKFSFMYLLGYLNFSSRSDVRPEDASGNEEKSMSKKKGLKPLVDCRAIGSNKALEMAQTNHESFQALELLSREVMHGVQNGILSREDAREIMEAHYIRHMLAVRGAAAVAGAKLSVLDDNVTKTPEELYDIASRTKFKKPKGDDTYKIIPPEGFEDDLELVYHAKIYESAAEFALRLEACLDEDFDKEIGEFEPVMPTIGEKTKELYPWLETEEKRARGTQVDYAMGGVVNEMLKENPENEELKILARKMAAMLMSALRPPPAILFGDESFVPQGSELQNPTMKKRLTPELSNTQQPLPD